MNGSTLAVFSPNRILSSSVVRLLIAGQVAFLLLLWCVSPPALLKPGEVLSALHDLWFEGFIVQLGVSFVLNLEAILVATGLSLLLAYLSVIPFFRPVVSLIGKLRFLSLAGLTYFFTILTTSRQQLKISLLVFSVSVFFVTSMVDVINSIPKEKYDLARTMRMPEWQVVWEVVVLGRIDFAFDVLRQNAAIGWMMLTMVEALVRSGGGIGTVLTDQTRHFRLEAIFVIQVTILLVGLGQDWALGRLKRLCCPYAELILERK